MIKAKNLTKLFGHIQAVDDISFSVGKGEVLGFLGPNGAGKTTTMKMLTGFLQPNFGTAKICGKDICLETKEAQKNIGYLPEGSPLYLEMTPRTFLEFIARARGLDGNKKQAAIEKVVETIGLGPVMEQSIETLSKGFGRRLGLAQALIHDPKVLILDEPTDGLDPNQKFEARALIARLSKQKAIIISTHILEEVDSLCTRVIIIHQGRVVADSTPHGLREKSRYHNAVVMRGSKAGHFKLARKLRALPGIEAVETKTEGEKAEVTVLAQGGRSPIAAIQNHIKEVGWRAEELSIDPGRLDDVFRSLTQGREVA